MGAMYDNEARYKLTADPTLAHLYHNHAGGFKREPAGVQVFGADQSQVNGWYDRKEAKEGPPRRSARSGDDWAHVNEGRCWYEKNDGSFIYRSRSGTWFIFGGFCSSYYCDAPAEQVNVPEKGWRRLGDERKAHTLRVTFALTI